MRKAANRRTVGAIALIVLSASRRSRAAEVNAVDLYLMQHGQATTDDENRERPLTDAGRAAGQRVARLGPRACGSAAACTAESFVPSRPRG
jgi:hypothetical protein